jgi:hypothetical protein
LVRNLPSKDADKAFHERVGKKYPDGTPIQNLAAELKRAGFSLHETIIVRAGVPLATFDYASLEQQGGLCMTRWSISWYPDQDDRARKLHGNYSRECL